MKKLVLSYLLIICALSSCTHVPSGKPYSSLTHKQLAYVKAFKEHRETYKDQVIIIDTPIESSKNHVCDHFIDKDVSRFFNKMGIDSTTVSKSVQCDAIIYEFAPLTNAKQITNVLFEIYNPYFSGFYALKIKCVVKEDWYTFLYNTEGGSAFVTYKFKTDKSVIEVHF